MLKLTATSLIVCVALAFSIQSVLGQGTFTAQLRGTVQDPVKATIQGAKVTITNDATQISEETTTDDVGQYIFNDLRPATYNLKVEAAGFKVAVRSNIVLRVGQQSDLDLVLEVGAVTTSVEVQATAPLLSSVSAALGQEVDNRHVTEVPLLDRTILNLAFLAPGVTEVGGGLFGNSSQLTGVNFVSNGQRLSTAEVRLDGGLISGPETGEGGMFTVSYQPPIEVVQEFKVQNNSFSAEYGNNGGTLINIVTKSGTNQFHGSGYWFGRRPQLDANDFYSNRAGQPKTDFVHDQYGGSVGGPIKRNKSFFFFDMERIRDASPNTVTTSVPRDAERQGDFSKTFNPDGSLMQIFNPFDTYTDSSGNVLRRPFSNNIIPASMIGPLQQKLMTFYPEPTGPGDPVTGLNNFTRGATSSNPSYSFDVKGDHMITAKSRLSGRYSRSSYHSIGANIYHNPADPTNSHSNGSSNNIVLEHNWTITPSTLWTNRGGVERTYGANHSPQFDPTTIGFPSILLAGGAKIFPRVEDSGGNYAALGTFGWTDTVAARTQPFMNSMLSKVAGPHNLKFGGEQRILLTNFWQPGFPGGYFQFSRYATNQNVFVPDSTQGNSIAGLLLDFGDPGTWGGLNIQPGTATKSKETAAFIQDDWRVTQRLTVNLGLRYEWSTPYTERYNRIQMADFTADTGINVPGVGEIHGINRFVDSHHRSLGPDRNNIGPRLGLAYRIGQKTVLRAGAGVYYGVNPLTNSWLTGSAFRKYAAWHSTLDGGITRYATLENPFPSGVVLPQNRKYGNMNMWGFTSDSVMTNTGFRNAEIYQWNAGVQHEFGNSFMVEVAYSANRSTHLPFSGTENRNIVTPEVAKQYGNQGLANLVPNPFQSFFVGPNAVFHEPDSIYDNATIPLGNLVVPYPQFPGGFNGNKLFVATSEYKALQLRVEKRYAYGLSFIASYTFSKLTDDSSVGNNSWLGNSAGIQNLYNLKGEQSVGGSDTPQRIVASVIYELPIGRGKPVGRNLNKWINGVVGGWQVSSFMSYQTGNPLNITMAAPVLAYGSQRPNVSGNPRGADIRTVVDGNGNYFNVDAFSAPPPQEPGNEPRFSDVLRGDTIHNIDFTLAKSFIFREEKKLQVRADAFNFFNTPRFGFPNTSYGDPGFGTINSQINYPRRVQFGARFLF